MNVKVIREYFERFKVERIYLKPERSFELT